MAHVKKTLKVVQHIRYDLEIGIGPECEAALRFELGCMLSNLDCLYPETRSFLKMIFASIDQEN